MCIYYILMFLNCAKMREFFKVFIAKKSILKNEEKNDFVNYIHT